MLKKVSLITFFFSSYSTWKLIPFPCRSPISHNIIPYFCSNKFFKNNNFHILLSKFHNVNLLLPQKVSVITLSFADYFTIKERKKTKNSSLFVSQFLFNRDIEPLSLDVSIVTRIIVTGTFSGFPIQRFRENEPHAIASRSRTLNERL